MAADVKNGFICPLCMLELESAASLQDHFDTAHNAATEVAIRKKSRIKGAVRRITKKKDQTATEGGSAIQPVAWSAQGLGVTRRTTLNFRQQRSKRLKAASEDQKIALRLEALLFEGPSARGGSNKKERKNFERSIVMWADNSMVRLCTGCGVKFSTMKRRHHCRLCGTVLCAKCSLGLNIPDAVDVCQLAVEIRTGKPAHLEPVIDEQDMRVCRFCHGALQSVHAKAIHDHKYLTQKKKGFPALSNAAKTLQDAIEAIDDMIPYYLEVAEALSRFEQLDEFKSASKLRSEITNKGQDIAVIGKKLKAVNDAKAKEESVRANGMRVRSAMITRIAEYVQANLIGLPKLPKEVDIEKAAKQQKEDESRAASRNGGGKDGSRLTHSGSESGRENLSRNISVRVTLESGSLVVYVERCEGLDAVGTNGSSNPYFMVIFRGSRKRSKTMKETLNPNFDEEVRFDNIGDLESAASEVVTVTVWSETKLKGKQKSKHPPLGRVNIPAGLAIDHGATFTTGLVAADDVTEWSPFTPIEKFAIQIQLLDDIQQFSIMNTVAAGMSFDQAMNLVQQFVQGHAVTRGSKADAVKAKKYITGLHQMQKLDEVQRDAILTSVMKGGMPIDEAMNLVNDFVQKGLSTEPETQNRKSQQGQGGDRALFKELFRMLAKFDKVQAEPIASAVKDGSMHVKEAIEHVKQFMAAEQKPEMSGAEDSTSAPMEMQSPPLSPIPDKGYKSDEDARRLFEMLKQLEDIQAQPIYESVQAGQMSIAEAISFVGQFIATVPDSDVPDNSDADTQTSALHQDNGVSTVLVHLFTQPNEGLFAAVDTIQVFGNVVEPFLFAHMSYSDPDEDGKTLSPKSYDGHAAVFRGVLNFPEGLDEPGDSVVLEVWDMPSGRDASFLGCAYIAVEKTLQDFGGKIEAKIQNPQGYLPAFDSSLHEQNRTSGAIHSQAPVTSQQVVPRVVEIRGPVGQSVVDSEFHQEHDRDITPSQSADGLSPPTGLRSPTENTVTSTVDTHPNYSSFVELLEVVGKDFGMPIYNAVLNGDASVEDGISACQSYLDSTEASQAVADPPQSDVMSTSPKVDRPKGLDPTLFARNSTMSNDSVFAHDSVPNSTSRQPVNYDHRESLNSNLTPLISPNTSHSPYGHHLSVNSEAMSEMASGNERAPEDYISWNHQDSIDRTSFSSDGNNGRQNYGSQRGYTNDNRRSNMRTHDSRNGIYENNDESPPSGSFDNRNNFDKHSIPPSDELITIKLFRGDNGYGLRMGTIAPADGAGIFVSEVYPDSTADGCGILPGDKIVAINGKDVSTARKAEVASFMLNVDSLDMVLLRPSTNGPFGPSRNVPYPVKLVKGSRGFGMRLSNIPDGAGVGVFISSVTDSGPASASGVVFPGCRILEVNKYSAAEATKASMTEFLRGVPEVDLLLSPADEALLGYESETTRSSSQPSQAGPTMRRCAVRRDDAQFQTYFITKGEKGFGMTTNSIPLSLGGGIVIRSVHPGGSADQVGIVKGCKIWEINGANVSNADKITVVNILRSQESVELKLTTPNDGFLQSDLNQDEHFQRPPRSISEAEEQARLKPYRLSNAKNNN